MRQIIVLFFSFLVTGLAIAGEYNDPKADHDVKKAMIESGISYNAKGQYKEAIAEFNKVIEITNTFF